MAAISKSDLEASKHQKPSTNSGKHHWCYSCVFITFFMVFQTVQVFKPAALWPQVHHFSLSVPFCGTTLWLKKQNSHFFMWESGLLSRFKTPLFGFCHWSPADVMFPASSAVHRSGFLGSNVASHWLLNGLWQAASPPPWLHFSSKQPESEAAERSVQKAESTNTLQHPRRGRTSEETTESK